ncbi:MAG TPA: peptide chain release factor N(5)-glutamine methyltransferase [Gammaproteobacteria bacterium]|nr:peptide chain release factor N(5)-glutamine methyltransferase [Gammaproteobacteria bacterium]
MPPAIQELLEDAATRLAGNGESARLDAELLLAYVLGKPRSHLRAWPEHAVDGDAQQAFERLLAARLQGSPLAYLTGEREFWSLPLRLTRDTLIPRPDTELLVQTALECIPVNATWRIADLGTGSGAIALALASERLLCRITATDVSHAALDVASENGARLGLSNIEFRHGDWYVPLQDTAYKLIVSNPPYVRDSDPHLQEGDVRFEPRRALVGGADGLDAIRHIIGQAPSHLIAGGWLLLEHGYDQVPDVRALFAARNFDAVRSLNDLSGHARVTLGRLPA